MSSIGMPSIASYIPKLIYDTSFIAPKTLSLINEMHDSSLFPRILVYPASFRVLMPVLYLFEVNCWVASLRLVIQVSASFSQSNQPCRGSILAAIKALE
jgi:hypothetical protein